MRLRALADNFQQMEVMGINSLGDCSYTPGPAPESFVLHFIPQAGGAEQNFRVALDMLNFDPGDATTGTVTLESVDITCFPVAALELTPVRTYTFEFSDTGNNRRHGAIVMLGGELQDLQLEPYPVQ